MWSTWLGGTSPALLFQGRLLLLLTAFAVVVVLCSVGSSVLWVAATAVGGPAAGLLLIGSGILLLVLGPLV